MFLFTDLFILVGCACFYLFEGISLKKVGFFNESIDIKDLVVFFLLPIKAKQAIFFQIK